MIVQHITFFAWKWNESIIFSMIIILRLLRNIYELDASMPFILTFFNSVAIFPSNQWLIVEWQVWNEKPPTLRRPSASLHFFSEKSQFFVKTPNHLKIFTNTHSLLPFIIGRRVSGFCSNSSRYGRKLWTLFWFSYTVWRCGLRLPTTNVRN